MDNRFFEILSLIQTARAAAYKAVNKELINLYWNVGAYIDEKLATAQWGDKTVDTRKPQFRHFTMQWQRQRSTAK